jgi:hypothetical protein
MTNHGCCPYSDSRSVGILFQETRLYTCLYVRLLATYWLWQSEELHRRRSKSTPATTETTTTESSSTAAVASCPSCVSERK